MALQSLKREFHMFLLTDYEEEEEFLRRRHLEGFRFIKVKIPGIYYFEKCPPEDMVYKLDFNPQNHKNKDSYHQMYRDYGWEYIQDLNEYSYFRKAVKEASPEDLEIFNDNTSKLDMLFRIFKLRMLPALAILFLIVIPCLINVLNSPASDITDIVLTAIAIGLFLFYLCVCTHCGIGFYRLRKKYGTRD